MISLQKLFTTNQAPNDEEQVRLKQSISEYGDKLTSITNKIQGDLEAQLQVLRDDKAAILELVAPFKRALSPFRQIPEDIVREIFNACLPTGRNPTMSCTEAPVLLTQISSATRRIALATPELWAAIHITFELPRRMKYAKSAMAARAEGVEEWLLRRSSNLPLHISVHFPGMMSYRERDLGESVLDILFSYCSRWKSALFSCVPQSLSRISTLTHTDVPILNSLSCLPRRCDNDIIDWNSSSVLKAPNLRRLIIPVSSDYVANWSGLTHIGFHPHMFDFTVGFVDDMANILRQTTRLTSCCLSIMPAFLGLPHPVAEISLPFLKVLIIPEYMEWTHHLVGGILSLIQAPALEAIQYNMNRNIDIRPADLIALLKRTPNLQEIWVGTFHKPSMLKECLKHCPSITSLRFSGLLRYEDERTFIESNAAIEAFVCGENQTQRLCPHLEHFRCDSYLYLSLSTLHRFLKRKHSPRQPFPRWSTVVIKVIYHPADKLSQYIDQLILKDGTGNMKLSVMLEKWAYSGNLLNQGVIAPTTP